MGQNPGYINNIETGKSKPSLDGFFYICEYLGVTPSAFFDTKARDLSRLDAVIADMKKLSAEQLDTIAALIKGLVKQQFIRKSTCYSKCFLIVSLFPQIVHYSCLFFNHSCTHC